MADHHIVPTEVTTDAGIPESQTVRLCQSCHAEAHSWYLARVRHTEYDAGSKRFRTKSYLEMVPEYQAAFSDLVRHKEDRSAAARRLRRSAPRGAAPPGTQPPTSRS
jgi:hypothetical protein